MNSANVRAELCTIFSVTVVIALLSSLKAAVGLQCFSCQTKGSGDTGGADTDHCGDPFDASAARKRGAAMIHRVDYFGRSCTACSKFVVQGVNADGSSKTFIKRQCVYDKWSGGSGACRPHSQDGLTGVMCSCTSDLCNGSPPSPRGGGPVVATLTILVPTLTVAVLHRVSAALLVL